MKQTFVSVFQRAWLMTAVSSLYILHVVMGDVIKRHLFVQGEGLALDVTQPAS